MDQSQITPKPGPSWRRITVLVLVAFALVVVLGAVLTILQG